MDHDLRVPHYVKKTLSRLRGDTLLVRQSSSTDEAVTKGDGHIYFTHPDGKPFPTASAAFCIRNRLVEPRQDGLFDDGSQTYQRAGE